MGQGEQMVVDLDHIHVFIYFSSVELFRFDCGRRLNFSPFDRLLISMR